MTKEEKKLEKQRKKELIKHNKRSSKLLKKHHKNHVLEDEPVDYGDRFYPNPKDGLTLDQVNQRIVSGLVNISKVTSSRSVTTIILKNVITFFNLLTAAIGSWLITVGAFTDLLFLVIVVSNVIIGIIQEIKAKKTIDKLSLMTAPTCTVIRDYGKKSDINIKDLVLDDVFELEVGKQIPADALVLSGTVEVNESLLTGESDSILKKEGDKLFAGSFVSSGTCLAVCDKIGSDNYIEKLTTAAKSVKKPKSELLKSLGLIIKIMAFIIIPMGAGLFYIQYFLNDISYVEAVRKTSGAMIGMIPSGLYLLSSVALAVSVMRLAKNNVMVQELYCIEMLARINVLCLDKTGTITDGTMVVKDVIDYSKVAGKLAKDIIPSILYTLDDSNVTSIALENHFGKSDQLMSIANIPFSSKRKFSAVSFQGLGTFTMGAPEFVMKERYKEVKETVELHAKKGYRVLSLVHRPAYIENNELPTCDFNLIALILIEDNIRPDAINTISHFKNAGVKVRVISGDNPITVSKIAERAGIPGADSYISLDGVSDDEVVLLANNYTVFGRVTPNQKALLIRSMKQQGNNVAMTGDGVNDILALKESDCSIAVASGSEAARNVSNLVLLDSNFDSMPKVVSEGRRVINNITSVACLFLTKTIFSFLLSILALNTVGFYPISTTQLAMIDFLCIGFPSFFLILEPNNKTFKGNFLFNVIKSALPGALTISLLSFLAFMLSKLMNLDSLSTSTIIIILATNTCLYVLFKVCRPFNRFKTIIFSTSFSLFLVFIFFLPNFFELRPLIPITEYKTEKRDTFYIESVPSFRRSEKNHVVIDNIYYDLVIDLPDDKRRDPFKLTARPNGQLIIDGNDTSYMLAMPAVSFDDSNNIFLYGDTFSSVSRTLFKELRVDANGDVFAVLINDQEILTLNLLHKLGFTSSDYKLEKDGSHYKVYYKKKIYLDKYGEEVVIQTPTFTFNDKDFIVINSTPAIDWKNRTHLNLSNFNTQDKSLIKVRIDSITETKFELYKSEELNEPFFITSTEFTKPNVMLSDPERLIYSFNQGLGSKFYYLDKDIYIKENQTEIKVDFYQKEKDDKYYMIVNGVETNVELVVIKTHGAIVRRFTFDSYLLLLMLLLLTTPLMYILNNVVPRIKNGISNILNFLNNR